MLPFPKAEGFGMTAGMLDRTDIFSLNTVTYQQMADRLNPFIRKGCAFLIIAFAGDDYTRC